jgi:DNA-binding winged helix-turn-helix (wHTH) protein
MPDAVIDFPPYRLDPIAGRLWRDTYPVPLRPKAWALLRYLAARPGVLVMKDELHAALWTDAVVSDDTLTHTMGELRQALGDTTRARRVIETVHRRGFRFIARLREPGSDAQPASSGAVPALTFEPETGTLVGRQAELAALDTLFDQASAGKRQIVIVEGEPGIGKSALVDAFVRALRSSSDRVLFGYGQCIEQHGEREPYMAVLEAPSDWPRSVRAHCAPPCARALRAGSRVAVAAEARDAERLRQWHADTTPQRMLREFAGLMEVISVDHLVVVVLEDLHWAITPRRTSWPCSRSGRSARG